MKSMQSEQTVTTLANALELSRCVVQEVLGNEVADSLNGSPLTRQTLYHLVGARIQANLGVYVGNL